MTKRGIDETGNENYFFGESVLALSINNRFYNSISPVSLYDTNKR